MCPQSTPPQRDYDYLFKLLLIGDAGSGKTSLLNRFGDDLFQVPYLSTIGVDFKIRTISLSGLTIKLQIWDTAGEERFRTITSSYYRGAHAILLVYDTTCQPTLDNIAHWLQEVERFGKEDVIKVLVGSKSDDPRRQVNRADAEAMAKSFNMPHIETSAKNDTNVNEAFYTAVKLIEPVASLQLGPWKWTKHHKMSRQTQDIVRTLLLCAHRTANQYALGGEPPCNPDTQPTKGLLYHFKKQWMSLTLAKTENKAQTMQTLALPPMPWEMWYEILGKLDVAHLRMRHVVPVPPKSSWSPWAMLFG
eukprot:m.228415 g.228415  ORF g.228415 m.228415 type:complete len:305 (+) comp15670_c0_seq3:120-1034(+)